MPYLDRDGDVFVLYLGNEGQTDSENRFHPDWIDAFHAKLDEVEAAEGPAALVTVATGKFFSNGLDTDWLFGNMDKMHWYLDRVHSVFSRLLAFGMPTVAALNGHAFGAGAMLATSHDFRVMRSDRGYWCLPEVHLGMPFTVAMNALVTERLTNQVALEAMTTGRRYGAADAIAAGIVDEAAEADGVLAAAVARAAALTGNRKPNLPVIKRALHGRALAGLNTPTTPENLAFGS
ncbi:enoyl-CoA hydratase [Nocardia sp. 852002-20019_SCH5090214]|jgi:enoyl-CoA hydratase/carnithine racemase|uniref:Enoyl-CoA hydratase n=1 Tax=Nocardia nova TaxID=37330 RepID=A0A2S6A124_9NOCA|nr:MULTISPECIES: enoyl-CoA hydratase-related protein [Nocardia]OBF77961.1 enoyl-CoA hydratase [Mycobacterium sp. 852002-51759_SCH5129042]MBF6145051.1 enoyl-CoA hydratase/isomerase family protein [Nocardia nova]MBF6276267.1 enoyl-CoA hydratase/isomerase family protein [Nocardia nova]MBV7702735.1 enoyl-CoA hydratase/isomerase family protein [Nocardia nova]OBA40867.1 enoyl-CoA hydratase [Nocardia sp. 852002-51101_SCH5132738]